MDTTDPDIKFDDKGICNYCKDYDLNELKRRAEKTNLPWLYHKIRKSGEGLKYDVILGLSGGVDSSLCLHYLVENGIRPLTFSIDNGWNTKEADENIMRLVEGLKVPFFRYTIDLEEFRNLQIAFIRAGVTNIEIPTDHILMASSYEMATKYAVKYIISGGNTATEAIMPKAWGYQARDLKHIKAIYKKLMDREIVNLPTISLLKYLFFRFILGIETVNLLDYYEYNRESAKKLLYEKYGWKDYGEKHCESTFTWWFQNWYLPTKFGIDKRKAHYSSLINSKQMVRADAMKKLLEPLQYPVLKIEEKVMKYPIHSYKDYPNNEKLWEFLSKIYAYIK